jgi:Ca2+-dependent lipid-binding protein
MLKTLVDEAVKLGFAQLIDPESMTIDVAQIMAAQSDTAAIGLVQLQVRQLETIHPKSQGNDKKKYIKGTVHDLTHHYIFFRP